MMDTSGAYMHQTLSAYLVVKNLLNLDQLWDRIEQSGVGHETQLDMFFGVQRFLRRSMRLLLRQSHCMLDVGSVIDRYQEGVSFFFDQVGDLLQDEELDAWEDSKERLVKQGVEESLASKLAACDFGLAAFDIVDAHLVVTEGALEATSLLYFRVRSGLGCQWFESQIREFPVTNQWTAMAREALLDDLYAQQGELIAMIIHAGRRELKITLDSGKNLDEVTRLAQAFESRLGPWIEQWQKTVAEMRTMAVVDHPVATVALRSLSDIVAAARNWANGEGGLACDMPAQ